MLLLSGQSLGSILGLAPVHLTELARAVCREGVQHHLKIQSSGPNLYCWSLSSPRLYMSR